MTVMHAERAVFETYRQDQLDRKISRYEATIDEMKQNLQAPDFYEGDRAEVEANTDFYERELRRLQLERELAMCTGLPGAFAA